MKSLFARNWALATGQVAGIDRKTRQKVGTPQEVHEFVICSKLSHIEVAGIPKNLSAHSQLQPIVYRVGEVLGGRNASKFRAQTPNAVQSYAPRLGSFQAERCPPPLWTNCRVRKNTARKPISCIKTRFFSCVCLILHRICGCHVRPTPPEWIVVKRFPWRICFTVV